MKDLFQEQQWRNSVEEALERAVVGTGARGKLLDAIRYSVFPGGKRVRPLLSCAISSDLGIDPLPLLPLFSLVELIHCATLIHDDLPGLDNDAVRRGKPACHIAFGEGAAILAGDLLAVGAIQQAYTLCPDPAAGALAQQLLSEAFVAVCNGQEQEFHVTSAEGLEEVRKLKTGALFGASAALTAVIAFPNKINMLKSIGEQIGVVFQLLDDISDAHLQFTSPESLNELWPGGIAVCDSSESVSPQRILWLRLCSSLEQLSGDLPLHGTDRPWETTKRLIKALFFLDLPL